MLIVMITNVLEGFTTDIIRTRENNKAIHKGKILGSNLKNLLIIIFINLLILVIVYKFYEFLDIWYIKLPFIFYICYTLGTVASFPIPENDYKSYSSNYYVRQKVYQKTILNTIAFGLLYLTYYGISHYLQKE
jgi:hypothetical protein